MHQHLSKIRSGVPAADITGLAALVRLENVHQGLSWLVGQNDGEPLRSHGQLANNLVAIGKDHVQASGTDIAALGRFAASLNRRFLRHRGMTENNLDRLRVFRNKEALTKLLNLPEQLFERRVASPNTKQGLVMIRDAVMLAVLRNHPIRRKNLLNLRLDENIERTRTGGTYLVIPSTEVKNRKYIEFEITPDLLAMIDKYVAFRPASVWLFPGLHADKPLNDS